MTSTKSPSAENQNPIKETIAKYKQETSQDLMVLDAFMLLCVVVGVMQFVYAVIVGNYPYNSFLAGFGSSVASFVLTAGLRTKLSELKSFNNVKESKDSSSISSPTKPLFTASSAFSEYIVCNIVLHFIIFNFIG
ncbi:Dolichyl-diphosphooligosaccharide-protein glycosyltransferase subunit 2 [Smittium culicis]|uniref:Dolichyl-diphosphooligosaccharide--protein glycosyltransferase subunit OST2 n=1 Tax=Smittium culicis TaxID=133412 RepID=A0A1R1XP01_9FUNG|nr:Dolichyl-diphosphooligosaccharide-protein glycosyltransferase subunit 2 [Smittium culicis]OMJ19256.1 Dolichyl-diphosphooligosaccharide-protein glycosyltransferase subunit 2 [Smittium culicis]